MSTSPSPPVLADEKGLSTPPHQLPNAEGEIHDLDSLTALGYTPELRRNRSLFTLLFQTLAIAAIPYGEGGPLISAIYGGGQLSIFVGWLVVLVLDECVAVSLGELASRYPTSAGPYYWSFQLAGERTRTVLSFITGVVWLVGNWTITLRFVDFHFLGEKVSFETPTGMDSLHDGEGAERECNFETSQSLRCETYKERPRQFQSRCGVSRCTNEK